MSSVKWILFLLLLLVNVGVVALAQSSTAAAREALTARLAARKAAAEVARLQADKEALALFEKRHAERQAQARAAALAAMPGDPKKGRMLFMTCMACHGLKGEGMRAFNSPRLAGQAPWYLRRELKKFRAGVRGAHPRDVTGAHMAPMAKLLSTDEKIDDVVAYIARLETSKPADGSKGDPAQGAQHYAVCATCHGKDAAGNEQQKAPELAGQHAWYLVRQLKNFRGGVRGYLDADVEGKLMVPLAQGLPDDQAIEDVVTYIQTLAGK